LWLTYRAKKEFSPLNMKTVQVATDVRPMEDTRRYHKRIPEIKTIGLTIDRVDLH